MAKKWREAVEVEYQGQTSEFGRIDTEARGNFLCKMYDAMTAQDSPTYYKAAMDNERPLSYTEALIKIYNNITQIPVRYPISEKDSPETVAMKKAQLKMVDDCLGAENKKSGKNQLEELIERCMQLEYPRILLAKNSFGRYIMNTTSLQAPRTANVDKKRIAELIKKADKLYRFADKNMGWTQSGRPVTDVFRNTKIALDNLNDKLAGRMVYWREHDVQDDLGRITKTANQLLQGRGNHAQTEKTLAAMLATHGFELHKVEVNPQDLTTPQANALCKTNILRAAFDGIIERPQTQFLSADMQKILRERLKREGEFTPQMYRPEESPVWRLYAQIPAFQKLEKDLRQGLANVRFPQDKLAVLTEMDINYLINIVNEPTAEQQREFSVLAQKCGIQYKDGVFMEHSARTDFVQQFAKEQEQGLQKYLQGRVFRYNNPELGIDFNVRYSQKDTGNIIDELKKGHNGSAASLTGIYASILMQVSEQAGHSPEDTNIMIANIRAETGNNDDYLQFKLRKKVYNALSGLNMPKEEINQLFDSFAFKSEIHHGQHISNNARYEAEKQTSFAQMNNRDNLYTMSPEEHRIMHLLDINVNSKGQIHFEKNYAQSYGTYFHDKGSDKYFTYEIRPIEHIVSYLNDGCLLTDEQFLGNIEQEVANHKSRQKVADKMALNAVLSDDNAVETAKNRVIRAVLRRDEHLSGREITGKAKQVRMNINYTGNNRKIPSFGQRRLARANTNG